MLSLSMLSFAEPRQGSGCSTHSIQWSPMVLFSSMFTLPSATDPENLHSSWHTAPHMVVQVLLWKFPPVSGGIITRKRYCKCSVEATKNPQPPMSPCALPEEKNIPFYCILVCKPKTNAVSGKFSKYYFDFIKQYVERLYMLGTAGWFQIWSHACRQPHLNCRLCCWSVSKVLTCLESSKTR